MGKVNWDERFIELAQLISTWSKDRSTGVGSVITTKDHRVISIGYNGFPSGANDKIEARHERPAKYQYTEHSERNAIYNAARSGVSTIGCTMYVMWQPCADCARGIIQSGIDRIVCTKPDDTDERWGPSFKIGQELLEECGVQITYIDLKKKVVLIPVKDDHLEKDSSTLKKSPRHQCITTDCCRESTRIE
jgi:dCMP deaminase